MEIKKSGLRVEVKNGNIESALKLLKKKMTREGVLRDLKKHKEYEKPSEKRRREKSDARKRLIKDRQNKERFENSRSSDGSRN